MNKYDLIGKRIKKGNMEGIVIHVSDSSFTIKNDNGYEKTFYTKKVNDKVLLLNPSKSNILLLNPDELQDVEITDMPSPTWLTSEGTSFIVKGDPEGLTFKTIGEAQARAKELGKKGYEVIKVPNSGYEEYFDKDEEGNYITIGSGSLQSIIPKISFVIPPKTTGNQSDEYRAYILKDVTGLENVEEVLKNVTGLENVENVNLSSQSSRKYGLQEKNALNLLGDFATMDEAVKAIWYYIKDCNYNYDSYLSKYNENVEKAKFNKTNLRVQNQVTSRRNNQQYNSQINSKENAVTGNSYTGVKGSHTSKGVKFECIFTKVRKSLRGKKLIDRFGNEILKQDKLSFDCTKFANELSQVLGQDDDSALKNIYNKINQSDYENMVDYYSDFVQACYETANELGIDEHYVDRIKCQLVASPYKKDYKNDDYYFNDTWYIIEGMPRNILDILTK